jgi:hypothetical protein
MTTQMEESKESVSKERVGDGEADRQQAEKKGQKVGEILTPEQ